MRRAGEPGKSPLELGAARTVAGDENHEIGEPAPRRRRFPAADPFLEPRHGVDDEAEILVFRPTRRTHDEAGGAAMHAQPREQRLAEPFPFRALHRHETRRGPVVQHARLLDAEAALEKRRQAARDAEVRVHPPRVAALVPASEPHRRMGASQAQAKQRESQVVPVDHELHASPMQRHPRDQQRRERRRVLDEHQIRLRQIAQRAPQTTTQPGGVEQTGYGVRSTRGSRRAGAASRDSTDGCECAHRR